MAYSTLAEVRALDVLTQDPSYTDQMITDGIAWADARIDDETGTSFEAKSQTITLDGTGTAWISTGVVHLTAVTAATIDAVAVADLSDWVARTDDGRVYRGDGEVFTATAGGANVALTVTAGLTVVPADIAAAARELARWYCLSQLSNTPSAMLQATEWGPASVTAFGGRGRPTGMPDVNATLRRHNYRLLSIG